MILGDGVNVSLGWLLEAWEEWRPVEWNVKMSALLWSTVDEEIKRLREVGLMDYMDIGLETTLMAIFCRRT